MADINNNEKNMQATEFKELLKIYTDHSLYTYEVDADGNIVYDVEGNPVIIPSQSELPPQSRVVAESLTAVHKQLDAKNTELDERVTSVEKEISELNASMKEKVSDNLTEMAKAIGAEADKARYEELLLLEKINIEKGRLDNFFLSAELGDAAIDTLREIQTWMDSDQTNTTDLVKHVNNIDKKVDDLASHVSVTYYTNSEIDTKIEEINKFLGDLQNNLSSDILDARTYTADEIATERSRSNTYTDTKIKELSDTVSINYYMNTEIDTKVEEINKAIGDVQAESVSGIEGAKAHAEALISTEEERTNNEIKALSDNIAITYCTNTEVNSKIEAINEVSSNLQDNINSVSERVTELEQEFIISCGNSEF